MDWTKKQVLITGAGGFIGSHLTEDLVERGANIKAFIKYNSRNDWGLLELLQRNKLDQIEVIMGDLRDADAIRNVTKDIDIIFHLGSIIAIPYSYIHPRETIETNIIGTLNMLTGSKENGVEKVIHTSTSEVYGTALYVPIDEKHPLQAQSPYSASKISADKIAESFHHSFNIPLVIVRPFNTYGPRQSARAVIPTIITQALTGKKIYLGSLHPTRDYTYIDDVIKAFITVAESKNISGEVINVGSNFEISINELAKKIIYLVGGKKEIIIDSKRKRPIKSEVERLWCDNSKAIQLLGWKPSVSFDDGLKKTISWISDNINIYKSEIYNQ